MAGISDVGAQSFDFYEGIRIFVPASVGLALAEAVHRTLTDPSTPLLTDNLGIALVGALFVGLVLYFLDIPTKSIVYRTGQPTDELEDMADGLGEISVLNAYFVLLDTAIPSQISARALYMGSIFRIGLETILLSTAAAFGVFSYSLYSERLVNDRPPLVETYCHWGMLGLALVAIVTMALDAKRLRSKARWHNAIWVTCCKIVSSIGWWGVPPLAVGVAFTWIASTADNPSPTVRMVGPLLLIGLWLAIYMRGRPFLAKTREPADGVTSVALFVTAAVALITTRVELTSDGTVLDGRLEYAGWVALLIVVSILLAARGHEKRLKGAYSTQKTWIAMNRAAVRAVLTITDAETEDQLGGEAANKHPAPEGGTDPSP